MKKKTQTIADPLDSYGMGKTIQSLIKKETEEIPDYLNWMELGNLYFYAEHLRPQLTPWIDKMQKHFADEDSECALISALAKSQEELKLLLLGEIVYIRKLIPIHEFWSLNALLPKLKGENRTLALKTMKNLINALPEENIDAQLSWLCEYYDVCTSKKEKAEIQEQIIQLAEKLHHAFRLCDLYKKIPDQRIADLWLTKLEKETQFTTLVNAAIISGQDAFFEKAKLEEIIAVESDTMYFLREKYEKHKDQRLLDLWLHALKTFHKKEGSNSHIVSHSFDAYKITKDGRFLDFIEPNWMYYSQKIELYALRPTPEILDMLKTECDSFDYAKDALLITGDRDFMFKVKYFIMQYTRNGLRNITNVYTELVKDPKKHKHHLKELKDFTEEHIDEFWGKCENPHDKQQFLKITW